MEHPVKSMDKNSRNCFSERMGGGTGSMRLLSGLVVQRFSPIAVTSEIVATGIDQKHGAGVHQMIGVLRCHWNAMFLEY